MNAKTIRKRLMRNLHRVFWGDRAYITVRLPLSLAPTSPPPLEFDGFEPTGIAGYWERPLSDGREEIHITDLSTNSDPTMHERESWRPAYFAEPTPYDSECWSYWTGFMAVHRMDSEGPLPVVRSPLSEDVVGRYRARVIWHKSLTETGTHPVLDEFVVARNHASSLHAHVDGEAIVLVYGVKWFQPRAKLRFCADLARAMRVAKAAGVPARIIQ